MTFAAIKDTPDNMPIDLAHTPGGLVLAAMQIARAVEAHKAKVTVYVPRPSQQSSRADIGRMITAHRE
jgi:ClpP class serine protease